MGKSPSQLTKKRPQSSKNVDDDTIIAPKRTRKSTSSPVVNGAADGVSRIPLSAVVVDCTERWFQETLKEAKAGDINMQVVLSQMYFNGYGVPKDAKKGKTWMTRAAKTRTSVWKVRYKRPGYNASDSDSDDDLNADS